MSHDYRKDRITRGMLMQGGACPAAGPPSLEQLAEERNELERRLQSIRDRIADLKKGNAS